MKKLLSSLSLFALALCLTAQLAYAMKRLQDDGTYEMGAIVKTQPQRPLEDNPSPVATKDVWPMIISYGCQDAKSFQALARVSKVWNTFATTAMLENTDFHPSFTDEVVLKYASRIRILDLSKNYNVTDNTLAQLTALTTLILHNSYKNSSYNKTR